MEDLTTIIDTSKQIWDAVNIDKLSIILGMTGYTLRDFKGITGMNKFKNLFSKNFPNGLETEAQSSILSDSFIEIEDYIKNSPNLDDKIFEEINKVLINGLSTEEMLTRIYINTLKQLSFIDLIILKEINITEFIYKRDTTLKYYYIVDKISNNKNCDKLPKEIINFSLIKLEKIGLILNEAKQLERVKNDSFYFKYISEFGEKLLEALEIEKI